MAARYWKRTLKLTLLVFALVILLFLLLHTPPAERLLARLASGWLSDALGVQVELGELDYRLWRGEVTLRNARVRSSEEEGGPVEAELERAQIRFAPFGTTTVAVHRPRIQVVTGGGESESDRPAFSPRLPGWLGELALTVERGELVLLDASRSPQLGVPGIELQVSGRGAWFEGRVGSSEIRLGGDELILGPARAEFRLGEGEATVSALRIEKDGSFVAGEGSIVSFAPFASRWQLDFDLDAKAIPSVALRGRVRGETELTTGEQKLAASTTLRGEDVYWEELGPWTLEGELAFDGGAVNVERLALAGYGGEVRLAGDVGIEERPTRLTVELRGLTLGALGRDLLGQPVPIASTLGGEANLTLQRFELEALSTEASLRLSPRRPSSREELPVGGDLRLRSSGALAEVERAALLIAGNPVRLRGTIPLLPAAGALRITGELERVDLESLPLPREPKGVASGSFTITGALGDPDFTASLVLEAFGAGTLVDPESRAQLRVSKRGSSLRIEDLEVTFERASMSVAGTYDLKTNRPSLRAEVREMRLSRTPLWPYEAFDATLVGLTAELGGTLGRPEGRATLQLEDVSYRETALPEMSAELRADGRNLAWTIDAGGVPLVEGSMSLEAPYAGEARAELARVPFDTLVELVPELSEADAVFRAQGGLVVSWPALDPARIHYRADVEQVVGTYRGVGFAVGWPFVIEGDLDRLRVDSLNLVGEETVIGVDGTVPLGGEGELDLRALGELRLELLNPALPGLELGGRAGLNFHVGGTFDRLVVEGDADIRDARATLAEGIELEGIEASVEATGDTLVVRKLDARFLDGDVRLKGELPLPTPDSDRPLRMSFEASGIDVSAIASEPGGESVGETVLLTLSGEIEAGGLTVSDLRGSGNVEYIQAMRAGVELTSQAPASWRLVEGRFELDELRLASGDSDLNVSLAADMAAEPIEWRASVEGTVENAMAVPPASGITVTGRTRVDLEVASGPEGPRFRGTAVTEGGRVVLREPPLVFSNVGAELRLQENVVTLSSLTAELGGGSVSAAGAARLDGFEAADVDATVQASSVRLRYPQGLRSESRGMLRLQGSSERYTLSGTITLVNGSYTADVTLENTLLNALNRQLAVFDPPSTFAQQLNLDIRVNSEDTLNVDNNVAQVQATTSLRVTGTLAIPEVTGLVIARPDGTFNLAGREYRIDSARVQLDGYPANPPSIDLTARTNVSGYEIELQVSGQGEELRTELRAPNNPELTSGDVASLLVTGRTLDTATTGGPTITNQQMVSYLTGALTDILRLGLTETLPFDRVALEPGAVSGETDPGTRFTVAKSLTEDLTLTYSVALNETEGQIWIVDYRLPYRMTLQGIQQEDDRFTGSVGQVLFFDLTDRAGDREPSPPRRRVGQVRIEGQVPVSESELLERAPLSTNEVYDYWRGLEGTDRMRQYLRKQGYLSARVEMTTAGADDNRTNIVYRVEPGSPVEIRWEGDDVGGDIKKKVREAWDGELPVALLLEDLRALVQEELYRERYYVNEVRASHDRVDDGPLIATFVVGRGPRGRRVDIDFEGNERLSDRALRQALPSSSAELLDLVVHQPSRLQQRLRVHYAQSGFVAARIGEPAWSFDSETGVLRIVVLVEEGNVFQVGSLAIEGNDEVPDSELRSTIRLEQGQPFRLEDYVRDRSRLSTAYRRRGFPEARVNASLEALEDEVVVRYTIDEGSQAVVGDVRIVGNYTTQESVVRRELTINSGDPVRLSEITNSQRNLYELGVFRSADIRTEPTGAEGEESIRDVVVELRELPDFRFNYGFRYDTENDSEIRLNLSAPNLFGKAHEVGLFANVSRQHSAYRVNYHLPHFIPYDLHTDIFVGRTFDETETEAATTWSFTFQQSRPLTDTTTLQWNYRFQEVSVDFKVGDSPFGQTIVTDRGRVSLSLIDDHRDNITRPTRGVFWNVTGEGAAPFLGSELQFAKLFGQLFSYVPLTDGVIWASTYRVGFANSFGQDLLEIDRFKAGGPNSLRGFDQNALTTFDPELGFDLEGGKSVLILNQELRFPVYGPVRGAVFWDAGNVFLEGTLTPFELRHDVGVGLRLDVPFGIVRLDWARVLDPRPDEDTSRFVFSLGHAF